METKETKSIDEIFKNIEHLYIRKEKKGYIVDAGIKKIHLPHTTNFEWRIKDPVEIKHMYFGAEAGKISDFSFNVTFHKAITLRISIGVRCYLYIDEIN